MAADWTPAIVAGIGAAATIIVAVVSFLGSRKSSVERQEEIRKKQEETRNLERQSKKLDQEYDEVADRARISALAEVNAELGRVRQRLEDAYKDADRLREVLKEKNATIDALYGTIEEQNRTIRRLTRRAETLEEWVNGNSDRFRELGIGELPDDILDDRRHSPTSRPDADDTARGR